MNEIEKKFKQDVEKSQKIDLKFDTEQLEINQDVIVPRRKNGRFIGLIIAASVCTVLVATIVPTAVYIINQLPTTSSVKTYQKRYNLNEIKIAESNTFKKLNNIAYPNGEIPTQSEIADEEKLAFDNFANVTYRSLIDTSKKDNMSYCPVGLYAILNQLSYAASLDEVKTNLNSILGLNETERVKFYQKVMLANSYASENTSTQIKNAAFFSNKFQYADSYVDQLSKIYTEAYELDFIKEAKKIVEWVNEAVNESGFIDTKFLELNEETCLYLFSTLYFKNAWANKYLSADNIKDDFHLSDNKTVQTTFMSHSYFTPKYYDYDSYISFKDYYQSRASITYLVPKNINDNIYTLTKDINIFSEDEEKAIYPSEDKEMGGHFKVNLKTPKFKLKAELDFERCLKNLGLEKMYDRDYNSFANAFTPESINGYNIYMQKVKQKNEVEFNEDGTIVKSVSMGAAGGAANMMNNAVLDVELNQPFIYIIRDANDTPIFVGHVDNPNAK